jgi:ArsR family transcriptional regulator
MQSRIHDDASEPTHAAVRPTTGVRDASQFRAAAKVMKAVADPVRLAILFHLQAGEQCVFEIAKAVGAERSNVSRHLSVLAGAGVLSSRKEGLMVFYTLRTPCILNVFTCVRGVLEEGLRQQQDAICCLSTSSEAEARP